MKDREGSWDRKLYKSSVPDPHPDTTENKEEEHNLGRGALLVCPLNLPPSDLEQV